jgi:hypothetical protein
VIVCARLRRKRPLRNRQPAAPSILSSNKIRQ